MHDAYIGVSEGARHILGDVHTRHSRAERLVCSGIVSHDFAPFFRKASAKGIARDPHTSSRPALEERSSIATGFPLHRSDRLPCEFDSSERKVQICRVT